MASFAHSRPAQSRSVFRKCELIVVASSGSYRRTRSLININTHTLLRLLFCGTVRERSRNLSNVGSARLADRFRFRSAAKHADARRRTCASCTSLRLFKPEQVEALRLSLTRCCASSSLVWSGSCLPIRCRGRKLGRLTSATTSKLVHFVKRARSCQTTCRLHYIKHNTTDCTH